MPHRPALSRPLAIAVALSLAGCTQPGTQASRSDAQRLDEATSAMASACGEALQTRGLSGHASVAAYEAAGTAGARKLLTVWRRSRTSIYQGETVNGIVSDSVTLLGQCGLHGAQQTLRRGIAPGH